MPDADDGSGTGSGSTSSNFNVTVCELCGWAAAVASMVAFGSFGVPVKSQVAQSLQIDPLVMQSYKTAVCFATSWLVLLLGGTSNSNNNDDDDADNDGEHYYTFHYTPWGIVSGLFWVPGGVATIFAIQNAGLAVAVGVSSSFIVLVSFTWGIFVFGEHVHSRFEAVLAVLCMVCGIAGMAYYSSPSVAHHAAYEQLPPASAATTTTKTETTNQGSIENEVVDTFRNELVEDVTGVGRISKSSFGLEQSDDEFDAEVDGRPNGARHQHLPSVPSGHVWFCGIRWQRRVLGVLAAVFNGAYGGSIMVPMKFAPPEAAGRTYVISFGIGASIVTVILWMFRYLYQCCRRKSLSEAFAALPSFYVRQMWFYGGLCGLLWSIGNFFSILSVQYLGEGVGYSVIQCGEGTL